MNSKVINSTFLTVLVLGALAGSGCAVSSFQYDELCGDGEATCGGLCVDLMSDPDNCGYCGHECDPGEVCTGGVCSSSCPGGETPCGGECVDLDTDPDNCGSCGHGCATGEMCVDGVCSTSCPAGQIECAGSCVDPLTDEDHCGSCGHACATGEMCVDGVCSTSCPAGQIECDGVCIDPLTDEDHCGASGTCTGLEIGEVCDPGEVCEMGECVLVCPTGQIVCDGVCIDPLTDEDHCGASGTCTGSAAGLVCDPGEICEMGVCVLDCPTGQIECAGVCIDPLTDSTYCGASGSCTGLEVGDTCDAGEVCEAGDCVLVCPSGQVACAGVCIDPMTDMTYCGAYDPCTGIAAGETCNPSTETCVSGVCTTSTTTPTAYPAGGMTSSFTQTNYLRGNYYLATTGGTLSEFEMRIDRSGSCVLDFYVHSTPTPGGTLTQVWSAQRSVSAGSGYVSSGTINATMTPGLTYYISVAWNCTTTSYMAYDTSLLGTFVGFGTLTGWVSTNSYPGYSTAYTGPIGTSTTGAYDQILWVF